MQTFQYFYEGATAWRLPHFNLETCPALKRCVRYMLALTRTCTQVMLITLHHPERQLPPANLVSNYILNICPAKYILRIFYRISNSNLGQQSERVNPKYSIIVVYCQGHIRGIHTYGQPYSLVLCRHGQPNTLIW
jgi:hypothetical protein